MTIDEELSLLEESIRRLKIEYDVYFGGGAKKPPTDSEWRVQTLIKKFESGGRMSFPQRFRYNTILQRYALFSDLWRQKLKIKEEGYRRPQDAALGIAGMRFTEEHQAEEALSAGTESAADQAFRMHCSDPDTEHDKVRALFDAMVEARKKAGDTGAAEAAFDSFQNFVKSKTAQIRKDYGCHNVEYSVELEGGQVRLKAKPKI